MLIMQGWILELVNVKVITHFWGRLRLVGIYQNDQEKTIRLILARRTPERFSSPNNPPRNQV
jgi:hypothetical protein